MELNLLIIILTAILTLLLIKTIKSKSKLPLPPGPPSYPFIGNTFWLLRRPSQQDLEPILQQLNSLYGPIFTLRTGPRIAIFIADSSIAHKALIQAGAALADRPPPVPSTRFLSAGQHNISSASYGPLWRLLRRNLMSQVLHSSRINVYGPGRRWVLGVLYGELRRQAEGNDGGVVAVDSFRFAMFCLLVLMCFGEKLDEKKIREIEKAQTDFLRSAGKLTVLTFVPRFMRYLFKERIEKAKKYRERQREIFKPLIEARRAYRKRRQEGEDVKEEEERFVYSYVDSLFEIELNEEGRSELNEEEMGALCSEFLSAGTDTTWTTLQWIMANLVKYQDVQDKLLKEIEEIVGNNHEMEITEEDLQRMPYLKAVVLEGLRLHPPGHFVLPHMVTQDVELSGYLIPKGALVNFMVAEIGRDGKLWENGAKFRPERFLSGGDGEGVDVTGSREIKMMPFGAGRRICPGLGLAMLHLEYFVGNLVRLFEWKAVEGEEVDLSEKTEFTAVMKNPLRAQIVPRIN